MSAGVSFRAASAEALVIRAIYFQCGGQAGFIAGIIARSITGAQKEHDKKYQRRKQCDSRIFGRDAICYFLAKLYDLFDKGIWWGRRWSGLCLWGGDFVWGFLLFVLSFQQSVHSMIPPSHFNIRFLNAEIVSAVWQYCRDFYFNDKLRTGDNPCLRPASRHKPNSGCCLE